MSKIKLSAHQHFIKTDMPKRLFLEIQDLFENNLTEALFKDKNLFAIKQ